MRAIPGVPNRLITVVAKSAETLRVAILSELRAIRRQLGLSFRDVYAASLDIAEQCRQPAFEIRPSGLHNIENKNMIPSIHRLHALALIYRRTMNELLSLYGIEPSESNSMEPIPNEVDEPK